MRRRAAAPVLGAVLLLAACGGPSTPSQPAASSTAPPTIAGASEKDGGIAATPSPSPSATSPSAPDPRLRPLTRVLAATSVATKSGRLQDRVLRGRNGQPFTVQEFLMACGRYDAAAVRRSLDAFSAGLPPGSFAVYIAPDKSSIRRAALGPRADALMECSDDVRRSTELAWPTTSGAVAPLWDQVSQIERSSPGAAYPYGDTHWSARAARTWVRDLVLRYERLGLLPKGTWASADVARGPKVAFTSTLLASVGVKHVEQVATERVVRPGVSTTTTSTPGRGNPTLDIRARSSRGASLVPGRTVLVRDSFVWRALPSLEPFFERLTVVHWAEFNDMVRSGRLPAADRYVFESVQRGWVQRSAALSRPDVLAAVATALGRPPAG